MNHRTAILDLRTPLEALRNTPGQLDETNVEVDLADELSDAYRYVGVGYCHVVHPSGRPRPLSGDCPPGGGPRLLFLLLS